MRRRVIAGILFAVVVGGVVSMRMWSDARVSHVPLPPGASCADGLVGADAHCGPDGHTPCCTSLRIPSATYVRTGGGPSCTRERLPARVHAFYLDRFEITVGRFRRFVEQGGGTRAHPPAVGAGRHPRIAASGWRREWNDELEPNEDALVRALDCGPGATFRERAGREDDLPMTCLTWFEAAAFCAWDGGRLPTEAEWSLAASGGDAERTYPWSREDDSGVDRRHAVYGEVRAKRVGSCSPLGDGRWGHSDLAGNVWEWMLDGHDGDDILPDQGASPCSTAGLFTPCDDCAALEADDARVLRSSGFGLPAAAMRVAVRRADDPNDRMHVFGARCARDVLDAAHPEPVARREPAVRADDGSVHAPAVAAMDLRVGDDASGLALRGFSSPSDDVSRVETLDLAALARSQTAPTGTRPRVLLVSLCAWSDQSAALVRMIEARRDAFRARGVTIVILLADGTRRGQPADAVDVASFGRAHAIRAPIAMDPGAHATDRCGASFLLDGASLRVLTTYADVASALAD